ncbi:hypothetical protein FOA43_004418 [Brettanomyces nanus]|uniref:Required for respiratory growth protein 7, mitochondrial n=1 Tax=Eeniella nana TaxID=13502 RepID=A0A875S5Y5_EENNA|nr:uncharacterized protein FOA43_004418 [Brettanomyces nanus]QPG77021.1 hypothetical protein FOA43_004418 [Brettanomyces nanus]
MNSDMTQVSQKEQENGNGPKKDRAILLPVISNKKYHNLETYLKYSNNKELSTDSTVFQGNFYELNFLEFLRRHFTVSRVIHQGGRDDKGIDIRAMWKPVDNFGKLSDGLNLSNRTFQPVNSVTRVKPILLKRNTNIRLFVQCKSWEKSRIDAKMIREINGTFNNTGPRGGRPGISSKTRRFLMVVCPTGFTRQGRIDFDKSLVPLIFIKFSKSTVNDRFKSLYDIHNYNLGTFESFYCNPMANALLKGLNWTEFMKRLVTDKSH